MSIGSGVRWKAWLAISGWIDDYPPLALQGKYVLRGEFDFDWWYFKSAKFVSEYATTNPYEDWADSWGSYFTFKYKIGITFGLRAIDAKKRGHLEAFFNALRS